jgi:hypothetical protein
MNGEDCDRCWSAVASSTVGRGLGLATLAIATTVPAYMVSAAARLSGRADVATRSRAWTARTSVVAAILTAPVWAVVILRGVLYPLFGSDNLEDSWGGPTLAGAWAVHLLVGLASVLAVSLVIASASSVRRPNGPESGPGSTR